MAGPARLPIVRHLIACHEVVEEGRDVSLLRLQTRIRPKPGDEFPLTHNVVLYAMLTEATGRHTLQYQLFSLDAEKESPRTGTPCTIDLGRDPIAFRGWKYAIPGLILEQPGAYEFRLLCDGVEIGSVSLQVVA